MDGKGRTKRRKKDEGAAFQVCCRICIVHCKSMPCTTFALRVRM